MAALNRQKIRELLTQGDAAQSAYEKGQKLEKLIAYLFEKIPGVKFYKANVVNNAGSEEVDVAFFNNKQKSGLPFLEYLLLVECKNWSAPVGASNVREFVAKLERRACAYGVLVAASGITGNAQDRNAAHDEIRMSLAMKRISIVVITRAEIENWADTADIVDLFKMKLCELTVDGSIFI